MKHLLVAYSWSINNIGDIGITPGLLSLIKKAEPNLDIVVIASQPVGDRAVEFLKKYLPKYNERCRVIANPFVDIKRLPESGASQTPDKLRQRWGEAKLEAFQKGCATCQDAQQISEDLLTLFPTDIYRKIGQNPEYREAFENAGFLLYNSGTTLNYGRLGVKNLWGYTLVWALPLLIARNINLPYGINSQSVDAVEWPLELVYKKLFKDARFFYCRDSDSLNYLEQKDLLNANSGFRPDSTFFFRGLDEPWAEVFLKQHSLKEKEYICLIIRYAGDKSTYHDPIGGTISPERKKNQMQKLRAFIEKWVAKTGVKVLICPETRGSIPHALEQVYSPLPDKIKKDCICMEEFWTSEQAYSVFKRARIVISMEMHSIIMSLNVGTPVIHNPFAEAGRKKWMLRDLGLANWLLDIDETGAEELLDTALKIHDNFSAAEKRIQKVLPLLETRALATIAEVKAGGRGKQVIAEIQFRRK